MKKSILLLLTVLPAAILTSCLDSDTNNTSSFSATMVQIKNNNGNTSLGTANYRYDIDFTDNLIDITIYDTDIYGTAFVLNDLPLTFSSTAGYLFHATDIIPEDASGNAISSLSITDIYGQYFNTLDMRFTINGTTTVTAIPNSAVYQFCDIFTQNDTTNYEYDECLVGLSYNITSDSTTVDITLNNIRFVEEMPVLTMTFPNIPISSSAAGNSLVFAANTIIPEIGNTPYPAYQLTDISGTVNPSFTSSGNYFSNENVTATFKCLGMTVSMSARMYN